VSAASILRHLIPARSALIVILRRGGVALMPPLPWLFAGRTTIAALLALYLAYALDLDSPFSAALSVLIVSNPVHGMVWSKSLYRIVGTLIGAVMAVILSALFIQSPELFLLALGIWMGLCVAASTLLRSFRSYGAVLAGYTVAMIAFPILPNAPDSLFSLMTARVSAVLVGIGCSALLGSLLTNRTAGRRLEQKLRATLRALADHLRRALGPGEWGEGEAQAQALRAEITAVEGLVEFAAAEGTEMAGLVESQRGSLVAMLASLTAAAATHDALEQIRLERGALSGEGDGGLGEGDVGLGEGDGGLGEGETGPARAELSPLIDLLSARLEDLSDALVGQERQELAATITGLLTDLVGLKGQLQDSLRGQDFTALRAFDRLDDLLDDLTIALRGLMALAEGKGGGPRIRLSFHIEWRWACINGVRAALAVWLAGFLWIVTSWSSGAMMVGAVIPNVALLSLRDRPDRDTLEFVKGISLAIAVDFLYLLYVLPHITGFPLLALALGLPLFWGSLQTCRPSRAFIGLGFVVFFLTLTAPGNAMRYDLSSFLNNSLAVLSGTLLTSLVHRLVLPVDPRFHIRALLTDIRRDLRRLAGPGALIPATVWESRMHDRLMRLTSRLRQIAAPAEDLLSGSHGALRMGREILRLRRLLADLPPMPGVAPAAAAALRALGDMSEDPQRAMRACRLAAGRLLRLSAQEERPDIAVRLSRASTSLTEIALLLGHHRHFFRHHFFRPNALKGES